MKVILLLLIFCHKFLARARTLVAHPQIANRRIKYGETVHTKIPYMIALVKDPGRTDWDVNTKQWFQSERDYYEFVCGGSLFKTQWVVTAAHCISDYTIHLAGVNGLYYTRMNKYHEVIFSVVHSQYRPHKEGQLTALDYDIGLIKTATEMRVPSTNVAYMATEPLSFFGDGPFVIYGWGHTHTGGSHKLWQMKVNYSDSIDVCNQDEGVRAGRILCFESEKEHQLLGSGDSGSPMVWINPDPLGGNSIVSLVTGGSSDDYGDFWYGPNISHFRPWLDITSGKLE